MFYRKRLLLMLLVFYLIAPVGEVLVFSQSDQAGNGDTVKNKEYTSDDYYEMGNASLLEGDFEKAMECFKKGVKKNPKRGNNYDGIGEIYRRQGKYEEALAWFHKAVDRSDALPNYGCPFQGLGLVYQKLGEPQEAEKYFLKEIEKEPDNYKGYRDSAYYYMQIGNLNKAETYLKKAFEKTSEESIVRELTEMRGFLFIMRRAYEEAERTFDFLVATYGENSATHVGLGHIYNIEKQYARAETHFMQALNNPGQWVQLALLGLGWVASNQHNHAQAIEWYSRLLHEEPLNMLALMGMGNAYNWLEEYDRAKAYFKRVLELDPDNEYALAELGTVYLNEKENDTAFELLRKSLMINSDVYSCPYEGLGLLYLADGRLTQAEDNFKKAIEINPEIEYRKYNGLAKIYIRQKKFTEAKKLLEKSIENYPYDEEAKNMLAKLAEHTQ